MDNTIGVPNTYPLDSDLSNRQRCAGFEQLGPELPASLFHMITVYAQAEKTRGSGNENEPVRLIRALADDMCSLRFLCLLF